MKTLYTLLTTLILLNISLVNAQSTFQKTLGSVLDEMLLSSKQTPDNGFIMAGFTSSNGAGMKDGLLVKIDVNGDTLWTKTYGGANDDEFEHVCLTSDGGYLLTGTTGSFGSGSSDIYLLKTNSTGDTLWTKAIGGTMEDSAFFAQQTTDNGYIICGATNSFGAGALDVYVIKTNSTGDTLWTKTIGGAQNDYGWTIEQTTDGGYIVAGQTSSFGTGVEDAYLIKLDANGAVVWTKTFGGAATDLGLAAIQTLDNGYIFTGYSVEPWPSDQWANIFLIKTDVNGDTLWTQKYGIDFSAEWGNRVQQTNNGDFIIVGGNNDNTAGNGIVMKTDNSGIPIWIRSFGDTGDDALDGLEINSDGGFLLTGRTSSFSVVGMDTYFIKTDSMGMSGCNQTSLSYNLAPYGPTVSNGGNISNGGAVTSTGTLINSGSYQDSILCLVACNLTLSSTSLNINCFGDSTGTINLSVSGAVGPATYSWSSGQSTEDVAALTAGLYSVVVTDSIGCGASENVTLTEPLELIITGTTVVSDTFGNCTGEIAVNATGGTVPYTYLWDANAANQTTQTANSLCAGNYCVTMSDSLNCSQIACDTIDSQAGITEVSIAIEVSVYPNPFTNSTTMYIETQVEKYASLELVIFNLLGEEVSRISNINDHIIEIQRNNLPAGTYVYSLITTDYKTIYKGKLTVN
jgi:SprB repeat/Secretion system C-terminal sorting domain